MYLPMVVKKSYTNTEADAISDTTFISNTRPTERPEAKMKAEATIALHGNNK